MSISFILITFLLQLSVGMVTTVAVLPTALVDNRFFKSISFWGILFTASALILKHYSSFQLSGVFVSDGTLPQRLQVTQVAYFGFLTAMILLWGRLTFVGGQLSKKTLLVVSLLGLMALFLDSLAFRPMIEPLWVHSVLLPLNFLSTALLLGGFLAGMIFGHYYLVTTDMPKKLLVTMSWILILVLILRILAVGVTLFCYWKWIHPGTNFLFALTSFAGHGIFFWQRILVGLVIPAIVVAMIWSTARIGSNQSATGIMYVAIAFVFIGELAARYLFLLSAIPL